MLNINLAYVAITGHTLPLWVGADKGFFERQGLNPKVTYIEGSVIATAALLSGDIDIVQETAVASVRAQLKGADTIVLAVHIPVTDQVLVGLPGIHSLNDLRNKTIGVTKAGTVSDQVLRLVLAKEGFVPGRDVEVTYLDTQPAQIAALQRGLVQAILVSPPNNLAAELAGGHAILDTSGMRIPYPEDGIVSTRKFVGAHPEVLQAFFKAWLQAIRFIKDHPGEAQAVLGKYTRQSDARVLRLSYGSLVNILPNNPVPRLEGIRLALSLDPQGQGKNPSNFIDSKPIEQAILALAGVVRP